MDDTEPTGETAKAQRQRTVTPLIWAALGLLVVLAFIAWLVLSPGPHGRPASAVVAPSEPPPGASKMP